MANFAKIAPADFSCKPFQIIGSDLMLVTASKPDGTVNTMTAGWGALGTMWGLPAVFTVIRPQRYTKEFVDAAAQFSLCFFHPSYKKMFGYLGTVSGRTEDKIKEAGLTVVYENGVPYFAEAQTVILATKLYAQVMTEESFVRTDISRQWYPEEDFHTSYVGRVDAILERQAR